ncbi:hypothetical protein [Pseudoalteromonas fuliginea]|uniref:hypothetical protein n=1 Tax=Pseudoalteromonas fuliginea TaxID=1872678 RepID=UPI00165E1A4D|nr:hypothetical protein [Pseudoalteromonas fuliginea]
MKLMLSLVFLLFSSFNAKAMDTGSYHQISQIFVWGDYAGGVIKISLKTPSQNTIEHCPGGFWIDAVNDKNASVYSTALAAFLAGDWLVNKKLTGVLSETAGSYLYSEGLKNNANDCFRTD